MKRVLVLYHSQEYGNTHAMAEAVAAGAQEAGAQVSLFNTQDGRFDVEQYRHYDAVAFGSPDYFSYIAGGLKVFLDDWYIAHRARPKGLSDKPYALFCSHGGGGAVRQSLETLFSRMGKQVGWTVTSHGAPTATVLEACRDLGRKLASAAL